MPDGCDDKQDFGVSHSQPCAVILIQQYKYIFNAYMPSEYATHGNWEDYAETFREVVELAYFSSGDDAQYTDFARDAYNDPLHNHNIGMRRVVMEDIIRGIWR